MTPDQGRRRASVLLILTSVVWLHEWFPALFVVAFVAWVLLHKRLEGDLGKDLLRLCQRVWPPATLVLVPLLVAGTVAYWVADLPIIRKVMPIALNVLALSMVVFGSSWRVFAQVKRFWPTRREPSDTKAGPAAEHGG
jgi:hypothetical protein